METISQLLNVPVDVITAGITVISFVVGLIKGKRHEKKKVSKVQ